MFKRDVQPGGEDHVVVLRASGWIRYVDISELILPAQPLLDLGDRAHVEGEAIFARLLEIGEESQILSEHRALAELEPLLELDDPKLDVDASCILVLKNCGPKGYPGFPEVGNFALPAKILKKGVTDMIRVSDARMSGTAYGTVVLHTAPEAAAGLQVHDTRSAESLASRGVIFERLRQRIET